MKQLELPFEYQYNDVIQIDQLRSAWRRRPYQLNLPMPMPCDRCGGWHMPVDPEEIRRAAMQSVVVVVDEIMFNILSSSQ